jgi:hypothetical protein
MTIMGTVYDCGYELDHGRPQPLPYIAVLCIAGDRERTPRFMVSSDLAALRERLQQFGLSRHPPNFFDPSRILEVWY